MNVIAYNAAYSLYPYATFERRDSLILNNLVRTRNALTKYATRGWRMIGNPSQLVKNIMASTHKNALYSPGFYVATPRWVCDSMSWTLPLDMVGVVLPPPLTPSTQDPEWDPVAESGWTLAQGWKDTHVTLKYETIKTTVFRWQYTSPDMQHLSCMLRFLSTQGRIEHLKVPVGRTRADIPDDVWTW